MNRLFPFPHSFLICTVLHQTYTFFANRTSNMKSEKLIETTNPNLSLPLFNATQISLSIITPLKIFQALHPKSIASSHSIYFHKCSSHFLISCVLSFNFPSRNFNSARSKIPSTKWASNTEKVFITTTYPNLGFDGCRDRGSVR